jgi:hypothetical protein
MYLYLYVYTHNEVLFVPNSTGWKRVWDAVGLVDADLTQCINWIVLESQLPHKIVDLFFYL